MDKLDLSKKYKNYYTAKTTPQIIEIEKAQFLSIVGKGDPSNQAFNEVIQALYSVAYTLKFMYKAEGKDFVVAKLEGLWWFDETQYGHYSMHEAPIKIPRSEWHYRLLIRLPDYVNEKNIEIAVAKSFNKTQLDLVKAVEWYSMEEKKVAQILHVGPFATEPQSLLKLNEFMNLGNFKRNGLHHEIYLSDFRKTAPEKLKTILREPVK